MILQNNGKNNITKSDLRNVVNKSGKLRCLPFFPQPFHFLIIQDQWQMFMWHKLLFLSLNYKHDDIYTQ